ncbi:MAG: hypothetical protein L3K26_05520 [Candidatus Hydrogenedentes bacterium]|nr:hypothetical protein [Candidatus Hydrogenedentota bacterium]
MLKNSLIAGMALLALAGCSKEPEHTYSEPLEQDGYDRQELIAEHRAQPVAMPGLAHVYVAGPGPERKDCVRCHKPGQEPYRDKSLPPGQDAHWEITVRHAGDMECFSCHMEENPAALLTVVTDDATLETAYLNCGSCHETQLKSWIGGAHGKRVTGWNGVRIIKNCTACHNPHSPARPKVIPVAQPTVTPERIKRR